MTLGTQWLYFYNNIKEIIPIACYGLALTLHRVCLEIKHFSKHFLPPVYNIHLYTLYTIRIMILEFKKFDIVCLEFEHVCLDFKGIYERGARGCLKVFNFKKYFFYNAVA